MVFVVIVFFVVVVFVDDVLVVVPPDEVLELEKLCLDEEEVLIDWEAEVVCGTTCWSPPPICIVISERLAILD